jgi:hypothetical protein
MPIQLLCIKRSSGIRGSIWSMPGGPHLLDFLVSSRSFHLGRKRFQLSKHDVVFSRDVWHIYPWLSNFIQHYPTMPMVFKHTWILHAQETHGKNPGKPRKSSAAPGVLHPHCESHQRPGPTQIRRRSATKKTTEISRGKTQLCFYTLPEYEALTWLMVERCWEGKYRLL